jgi:hypothetical protein
VAPEPAPDARLDLAELDEELVDAQRSGRARFGSHGRRLPRRCGAGRPQKPCAIRSLGGTGDNARIAFPNALMELTHDP